MEVGYSQIQSHNHMYVRMYICMYMPAHGVMSLCSCDFMIITIALVDKQYFNLHSCNIIFLDGKHQLITYYICMLCCSFMFNIMYM